MPRHCANRPRVNFGAHDTSTSLSTATSPLETPAGEFPHPKHLPAHLTRIRSPNPRSTNHPRSFRVPRHHSNRPPVSFPAQNTSPPTSRVPAAPIPAVKTLRGPFGCHVTARNRAIRPNPPLTNHPRPFQVPRHRSYHPLVSFPTQNTSLPTSTVSPAPFPAVKTICGPFGCHVTARNRTIRPPGESPPPYNA